MKSCSSVPSCEQQVKVSRVSSGDSSHQRKELNTFWSSASTVASSCADGSTSNGGYAQRDKPFFIPIFTCESAISLNSDKKVVSQLVHPSRPHSSVEGLFNASEGRQDRLRFARRSSIATYAGDCSTTLPGVAGRTNVGQPCGSSDPPLLHQNGETGSRLSTSEQETANNLPDEEKPAIGGQKRYSKLHKQLSLSLPPTGRTHTSSTSELRGFGSSSNFLLKRLQKAVSFSGRTDTLDNNSDSNCTSTSASPPVEYAEYQDGKSERSDSFPGSVGDDHSLLQGHPLSPPDFSFNVQESFDPEPSRDEDETNSTCSSVTVIHMTGKCASLFFF